MLGTLLVLGVALVVLVLVLQLVFGVTPGGGTGASPSASATAADGGGAGTVTVPETVGRPTREAIELAQEAGLNWTVRCAEDPTQAEGIIRQEPPAGTTVTPGSRFTMFSARISDCR